MSVWNVIDWVGVEIQCQSVEFDGRLVDWYWYTGTGTLVGTVLSQCVTCITVRMKEAHRHDVLALVALYLDNQAKTLDYRQGQVSSWDFGRTWNRKRQCGVADLGGLDPDGEEEEEGGDVDDDGQAEAAVEEEGGGGPDVRPPPVHVCRTGRV